MRSSTTSKFTGLSKAIERLNTFQKSVPEDIQSELKVLGINIRERARKYAPRDTGALRRGIQYKVLNNKLYVYAHAYNKRTGYDYAYIQHNNPEYHHVEGEYLYLKKAVDIESRNYISRVRRRLKSHG